jgi:Na+(H+)/acetate symporter ActP
MLLATIDPWILAFSAVTVIVTIWMGFWSAGKSRTASDFFVAGRNVSVGWNASAISGEYLSAASFMGIAGMVMSSGYDALWYPVGYACGYLFLLLFIAGPLRRFGAYTIPDFAEGRFDSPLFRKIAVCFVLFIGFFYTMPQMKGAGTTLAYIFPGLPYWAGVVVVGAVITLNVALGGMKGITLVQAFQYWLKMFAISVPIFALMAVYGHYGKHLAATGEKGESARIIRHPQNYEVWSAPKIIAIKGKSDIVTLALYKAKQRFRNWFEEKIRVAPVKQGSVVDVVEAYLEFAGRDAYVDGALRQIPTRFDLDLDHLRPRREHMEYIEQTLRTNPVMNVVRLDGKIYFVFATNVAWEAATAIANAQHAGPGVKRAALPEKAPDDSTWLSPFGPLTTRAARAATMPRTLSDFELIGKDKHLASAISRLDQFTYPANIFGLLTRLEHMFNKPIPLTWQAMIPPTTSNVVAYMPLPLMLYAAAIGKPVYWQTNMRVQRFELDLSHTAQTTDAEMAARIETALRSNGVAMVTSPKGAVIAVEMAELDRLRSQYGLRPAALSQADIRPYALLYTYSLIIALVCGTAGLPHILVRFYTNPDGVAAKRTTMWVMILIGCFYVFPPVFGVMGRNLLPELYAGVGAKGTDKVVLELPRILNEQRGEAPATSDGEISSAPPPLFSSAASPASKSSRRFPWGSILSGITCAGAFAAFMSTFSGLLVSMTGALAHDVYGRMLRPRATPQQRMRMFRIGAVVLGAGAIVAGMFVEPLEINFMVGQAFAIAAASYFPLLFMSIWWRGMTMKGAATGMLTGGLCALAAVTLTNFSNLATDPGPPGRLFAGFAPLNEFWAAHPLLRILCEQPAIWAVPLAIVLMIVVSRLTRRDVPADVRMKMLVLHAPEKLGLKQEYIQEHAPGH